MESNLTVKRGGELALAAPVVGLSAFETKAVLAWETPKVSEAITNNKEAETKLVAIITVKLQETVRRSGVGVKMEAHDMELIARDIIAVLQEFPRLRLGEVGLIFDLGAVGKFGDFVGHGINARTFRSWVVAFENETRNQLLLRQIKAKQADEEKASQEKVKRDAWLYDLLSVESLVAEFSDAYNAIKSGPSDLKPYQQVPADIDVANLWFRKFKAAGLLDKFAPLTTPERQAIFQEQVKTAKVVAWGQRRPESEIHTDAKFRSESVWFRMAIANLILKGTTSERFGDMLETLGMARKGWRKELEEYYQKGVEA